MGTDEAIPIRDPNIMQGNVTPENHFTSRASQGHVAPRKNPQELVVTTVSHVTTSVSRTLLNMHFPPEPYEVLHVFVCICVYVYVFMAFYLANILDACVCVYVCVGSLFRIFAR